MNSKAKILFTATFSTPFIQSDISVLKKYFSVTVSIRSGLIAFIRFLLLVPAHTHTFTWFASTYSAAIVFLSKIFGKRSIIVLGGVDVANIPEIQYGIWTSWWRQILVRYAITNADRVLAVDGSLKKDAIMLAQYDGGNILVVPTGYDATFWKPDGIKENFVLTVANCDTIIRAKIKGIDVLNQVARSLPEIRFIVIGIHRSIVDSFDFPKNIEVFDFVPQDRLLEFYQKAKIYLQPSLREGLPNTLCEAMLCECYPIGTNVGGIPTAIGTTGAIFNIGDTDAVKNHILLALSLGNCDSARKRIVDEFSLQRREEKLQEIIQG